MEGVGPEELEHVVDDVLEDGRPLDVELARQQNLWQDKCQKERKKGHRLYKKKVSTVQSISNNALPYCKERKGYRNK